MDLKKLLAREGNDKSTVVPLTAPRFAWGEHRGPKLQSIAKSKGEYQVIQFVTFSSPIVGGHLTIPKRSLLNHLVGIVDPKSCGRELLALPSLHLCAWKEIGGLQDP